MTTLVGRREVSDGVVWQITQPDDPGVLTMVFPEQVATDAAVPDVSPPEIGQEAWTGDFWTLDFDAVREHLDRHSSPHFPRGPGAKSARFPPRWAPRCASKSRQRCSGSGKPTTIQTSDHERHRNRARDVDVIRSFCQAYSAPVPGYL
jgi:hypothetical protein